MAENPSLPQFIPNAEFLRILKKGGADHDVMTMKEIVTHTLNYIKMRKICDPNNFLSINCVNDEIGKVFGVGRFSSNQLLSLIKGQIQVASSLKRGGDRLDDEPKAKAFAASSNYDSKGVQTPCYPSYFFIIPKYAPYESESDSPLSVQGYETDWAKDPSDDPSSSDSETDVETKTYEIEFEVASSDELSAPDTDSDIDEPVHTTIFASDSDVEFWADESDSEDCSTEDTDPDLVLDRWKCKCGIENKAMFRYCVKCWNLRKGWLPESRSTLRKPRKKRAKNKKVGSITSQDPSGSSQEIFPLENIEVNAKELVNVPQSSNLCSFCLQRTKSATLIHGRTGHQVCCYPCGRKLEEMKKPCPVCRRTISKVIKNFWM